MQDKEQKPQEKKTEEAPKETAKEAPKEPPKEAPKEPPKEAPKEPPKETPKEKARTQRPKECIACSKSLKKGWYYREGKYYCGKGCWKKSKKSETESKKAKEAK